MNSKERERLHELCEMASKERDHGKMIKLVREINELPEAKEKRMGQESHSGADGTLNTL